MSDEDARDYKRLVEATARLRTLERLNRLVSSSLAFEEVLAAIARAASDIMAAPIVSFWVVDEGAGTVTIRAFSDPALRDDFPLTVTKVGEGLAGRVAANRRPFHVPDVFVPDSPVRAGDWFRRHGVSSFYGVPVLFQDRLLAVLALNGRAPFVLDEEDQELLGSFVAQAAVATHNAMLFAEAEVRRRGAEATEARYRELFERNLVGILRTKPDGHILECNDALVRMLGYTTRTVGSASRRESPPRAGWPTRAPGPPSLRVPPTCPRPKTSPTKRSRCSAVVMTIPAGAGVGPLTPSGSW